jgi:very-short-patch-repair endonuclease
MSIIFAKSLRKRMTDAEQKLWKNLRSKQIVATKFRRQQPIGPYIVDFVSFKEKLIIEVDGGQHAEQVENDQIRDLYFIHKGYKILRFWNNEVLQNIKGVLEAIKLEVLNNAPSPCPLPQGERES